MKIRPGSWLTAAMLAAVLVATFVSPALAQVTPLAGVAVIGPIGGSGINGSATLMAAGAQTVVTVRIGNAPPNAMLATDIHAGICNGPDRGLAYSLSTLTINAQGQATSNTTVNAPLATILSEGNYVSIHSGPAATSSSVACGQIAITSGRLPAAPAVRLPATGSHTPVGTPLAPVVAISVLGAAAAAAALASAAASLVRRRSGRR
jgi:hypothetical protein